MTVNKISNKEGEFSFQVSDTDSETPALEIVDRFGAAKGNYGGFFADVLFTAAFTGTIEVHLGPNKDRQVRIPELDLVIDADAGSHTIDIATRAHYAKLVFISGFAFAGEVLISR